MFGSLLQGGRTRIQCNLHKIYTRMNDVSHGVIHLRFVLVFGSTCNPRCNVGGLLSDVGAFELGRSCGVYRRVLGDESVVSVRYVAMFGEISVIALVGV